jgi:hypothetical protein
MQDHDIIENGKKDLHRAPETVRRAFNVLTRQVDDLLAAVRVEPSVPFMETRLRAAGFRVEDHREAQPGFNADGSENPDIQMPEDEPAAALRAARNHRDLWVQRFGVHHIQRMMYQHQPVHFSNKTSVIVYDSLRKMQTGTYANAIDSDAVCAATLFVCGWLLAVEVNTAQAGGETFVLLNDCLRNLQGRRTRKAEFDAEQRVRDFIEDVLYFAPEHREVYYWLKDKRDVWVAGSLNMGSHLVVLPREETRNRAVRELATVWEAGWKEAGDSESDTEERFRRIEDEAATLEARVRELETAVALMTTDREGK